jgi:hypothetical protein
MSSLASERTVIYPDNYIRAVDLPANVKWITTDWRTFFCTHSSPRSTSVSKSPEIVPADPLFSAANFQLLHDVGKPAFRFIFVDVRFGPKGDISPEASGGLASRLASFRSIAPHYG